MVLLICQHCEYRWDYRGENEQYATCPKCRYKVRIAENQAEEIRQKGLNQKKKNKFSLKESPAKLVGIAGMVNKVLDSYRHDESMLIQVLLSLQKSFGWLTMEMLWEVSEQLRVPIGQVYQVATFYKAFSLSPRGKHLIRMCTGTSCKVRGGMAVLDRVQSILGIERGETTMDGMYSLETVNCLGCCALGPVMTVDDEYHGNVKLLQVKRILSGYK
jgi:NADH-quinone oxidoreductase subunit E